MYAGGSGACLRCLSLCRGLKEVGLGVAYCGGPLRIGGEEAGEAGVHVESAK